MKTLFYFMIALLFVACNKEESADLFLAGNDDTYALETNRICNEFSGITFPRDELAESDYVEETPSITGYVELLNNQQEVEISLTGQGSSTESIVGTLTQKSNNSRYYQLGEGTFAGGRFIMWQENENTQFELTIYGSGRPILFSARGILKIDSE